MDLITSSILVLNLITNQHEYRNAGRIEHNVEEEDRTAVVHIA